MSNLISFSRKDKRVIVALLLDKRDESKSPLEVQVLLYNDNLALVKHYDNILLCDIVTINNTVFLRRKESVLDMTDFILL